MFFRDIIGQTPAKDELRRSFLAGVVPHARLIVGQDGAGALGMAYAYARYINCEHPSESDACGHCRSCLRYNDFAALDLHFLFPIASNKNSSNYCDDELPLWRKFLALGAHSRYAQWLSLLGEESKSLMIYAREEESLSQRLSYQIAEARYRVVLIWLPERMHHVLGNKLLKLTEEPPERTIILMVSEQEGEVLGTLLSRMQTLHLRPLSEAEIVEALSKETSPVPNADATRSAHLAGGNYRNALDDYLGLVDARDETTKLFGRTLRATVNARPQEIRSLSEELAKMSREEQTALLTYMGRMFREIYVYSFGVQQVNYLTVAETGIAKYLSGCVDTHNVTAIAGEIDLALRHVAGNVNARMVFFDFILRLTSILAPSYKAHGIR